LHFLFSIDQSFLFYHLLIFIVYLLLNNFLFIIYLLLNITILLFNQLEGKTEKSIKKITIGKLTNDI